MKNNFIKKMEFQKRVLACSKEDGFMEFVSNSLNLQEILKKYSDNLQEYFK